MGLDVEIIFKSKTAEPRLEGYLPPGFEIIPVDEFTMDDLPEATHQIDTGSRYYGIGYERGPWPQIAAVLMELFASEDVEKVWYGHDNGTLEIGAGEVLAISSHYMKNGQRPYRRGDS